MKHLGILLVSLLFMFKIATADTFVVTSNADSGPGTLREAIQLAALNGIINHDIIHFNLSGSTEAERTIILLTELPNITSNITIDGTSQPGTPLGISSAKVILYLNHYIPETFRLLILENVNDINVYGLCFKRFEYDHGSAIGIYMSNCERVHIGSPGKGNLFYRMIGSISDLDDKLIKGSVKDITIQSNIFGLDTDGSKFAGGHISIGDSENIVVGGENATEGNIFVGADVTLVQSPNLERSFFANIQNNFFNLARDGSQYYDADGGVRLIGNNDDNNSMVKTIVSNNIFSGDGGVSLGLVKHKALVQGNKIGTDITGRICLGEGSISYGTSSNVVIGGYAEEEENIITGYISGLPRGGHIIKNSIAGKIVTNSAGPIDPFIKITYYDNGIIRGTSNPNAKIQLYINNCYERCLFKKYLSTTFANAEGEWTYAYTINESIVATATTTDSSTSEFSEPKYNIQNFITELTIIDPTCGRSNGSIIGIKVLEGTHFGWYNDNTDQLISSDTNLVNVPEGAYSIRISNGPLCPVIHQFSLYNRDLPSSLDINIGDASCGKNDGNLTGYDLGWASKWFSSFSDSLGTVTFIDGLFAGEYFLKLWSQSDTSCNKIYGPFVIKNNSGPTLNFNDAIISPVICNNSVGSIVGISAAGVAGDAHIVWKDSLNNIVGTGFDLTNQPAGKYSLEFKDEGGCDTIISPYFIIPSTGNISIDTTGKNIVAAGCAIPNGSINNISVSGATSLQWKNIDDNTIVGDQMNVSSLKAGEYQLFATNQYNCSASSPPITVPPGEFADISPMKPSITNAACDQNNGTIRIEGFTNENALSIYHWINSSTNDNLGSQLTIEQLGAGNYKLMATDTNGCVKQIFSADINLGAKPQIDKSRAGILDDKCNLNEAAIKGFQIIGLINSPEYLWKDENDNIVSTSLDVSGIGEGTYQLTVKDGAFCIVMSDPITITNDNSTPLPSYTDLIIPRNTSTTLLVNNYLAGKYLSYSDPLGNQLIEENSTGIFNTSVLDEDKSFYIRHINAACSSEIKKVNVTVVDKSEFAVPTAFTPNGDNLNDILHVNVIGHIELFSFKIFNRWGKLVFQTNDITKGWDGRLGADSQPAGMFVWTAEGKDLMGNTIRSNGSFALIR